MLVLMNDGVVLRPVNPGAYVEVEAGLVLTEAYDGWVYGDYYLQEVEDPTPTPPEGQRQVSSTIEIVGGVPTYVRVFEDIPGETDEVKKININAERDERITWPFYYAPLDKWFDNDVISAKRLVGAATIAGFAMGAGAIAGNYRWHGGDYDFFWICADNTTVIIDAPTMFDIGTFMMGRETTYIGYATVLKAMVPIPDDYRDDSYWITPVV